MQTNREPNGTCLVGTDGVTHYHPLILPWNNIACVITEKSRCITIGGKDSVATVQVKKQLTRPCFRFGRQFKRMFSFWTFLWLDSKPLGGSLRRLWCTSGRLFFTFEQPEGRGE